MGTCTLCTKQIHNYIQTRDIYTDNFELKGNKIKNISLTRLQAVLKGMLVRKRFNIIRSREYTIKAFNEADSLLILNIVSSKIITA
jgi:hypothetical protein